MPPSPNFSCLLIGRERHRSLRFKNFTSFVDELELVPLLNKGYSTERIPVSLCATLLAE